MDLTTPCGKCIGRRATIPRATNYYGGAQLLLRAPKCPNNITSTFLNTVHLLQRDLSFEHWGAPDLLLTPDPIKPRFTPDRKYDVRIAKRKLKLTAWIATVLRACCWRFMGMLVTTACRSSPRQRQQEHVQNRDRSLSLESHFDLGISTTCSPLIIAANPDKWFARSQLLLSLSGENSIDNESKTSNHQLYFAPKPL